MDRVCCSSLVGVSYLWMTLEGGGATDWRLIWANTGAKVSSWFCLAERELLQGTCSRQPVPWGHSQSAVLLWGYKRKSGRFSLSYCQHYIRIFKWYWWGYEETGTFTHWLFRGHVGNIHQSWKYAYPWTTSHFREFTSRNSIYIWALRYLYQSVHCQLVCNSKFGNDIKTINRGMVKIY